MSCNVVTRQIFREALEDLHDIIRISSYCDLPCNYLMISPTAGHRRIWNRGSILIAFL